MQKPIRKLPIRRRGDKWILDIRKLRTHLDVEVFTSIVMLRRC